MYSISVVLRCTFRYLLTILGWRTFLYVPKAPPGRFCKRYQRWLVVCIPFPWPLSPVASLLTGRSPIGPSSKLLHLIRSLPHPRALRYAPLPLQTLRNPTFRYVTTSQPMTTLLPRSLRNPTHPYVTTNEPITVLQRNKHFFITSTTETCISTWIWNFRKTQWFSDLAVELRNFYLIFFAARTQVGAFRGINDPKGLPGGGRPFFASGRLMYGVGVIILLGHFNDRPGASFSNKYKLVKMQYSN